MVTNKKTTYLIKKIILLLILVFFSNLFYLYFKKNEKEAFVYTKYDTDKSSDVSAVDFLSDPISKSDMETNNIAISAPHGNGNQKITSLTHAVDFALKNNPKSFHSSQGKPKQFPINTIVDTQCTNMKTNGDNNDAVACMYKPASVAFGYKILPLTGTTDDGIREDSSANIYLDNYDQIDKIIEREKIDKNYISKNTDSIMYKLRDDNEEKINHRGAVEVAYSRKEELNNTKNKYNIENTRNYSINLQYILLFCVILTSIIVLGLYYMSFISNIALIIYIILVTLVIYFFNIINIIN